MTVRLFIDVDGVLNALEPTDAWPDYQVEPFIGAINDRITFSPTLMQRLGALDVEIHWCTAWFQYASLYLSTIFGFGADRPHLRAKNGIHDFPTILWKIECVREVVEAEPGPFIHIDDEMRPEDIAWAESVGGLAIAADPYHGITPSQMDQIEAYVAAHR